MGPSSQDRFSRREGNKKRSKASVRIEPSGGLTITIATGPQLSSSGFSVKEDVRLVRSALLYADHVELISPGALMIASLAAGAGQGPDFVFELMGNLDESVLRHLGYTGDVDQMRTVLDAMKRLNDLPRAERRRLLGPDGNRQIRSIVAEMVGTFLGGEQGFEAIVSSLFEQAGAPDLGIAAEAGLLTLSTDAFEFDAQTGLQMEQYAGTLRRLLGDPHSHLMFDEQIASIATAMVRDEQVEMHPLTAEHALRTVTGTGLVERLPAFPDASMEAILDTRKELASSLVCYRTGVIGLTAKLRSGPLEPALRAEIADLWRDEVQPTLASLRQDLSATRIVRDAAFNLATDAKAVVSGAAGAGVLFGIGSVAELAQWSAGAVAGAGGLVAHSVTGALREASTTRQTAHSHELYYLLAANDHLR